MGNKEFYKALGAVLRHEREKTPITQPEMARRLGVTKQLVSFWEKGQRTMSAQHLVMYCQILGITAQSVLDQVEV